MSDAGSGNDRRKIDKKEEHTLKLRFFILVKKEVTDMDSLKNIVETLFPLQFYFYFTGVAAILYECRLGCLENEVPEDTQNYINALHLMFSSFKTTMYAGAIPKWLRPIIPKPWEEFCFSWDGLFKFSKWSAAGYVQPHMHINTFYSGVLVFA